MKYLLLMLIVVWFTAMGITSGCANYHSKSHTKETSIKMEGEEFKMVDDEIYPENVYHIKVVHITI